MKLLAIVPYRGLEETVTEAARAFEDVQVHVYVGNMAEGAQAAKDLQNDGYDVVISRGRTADLIEAVCQIPVVRIPIFECDMLRAIKIAQNFSAKTAIVVFSALAGCARSVCSLLQYDIEICSIEREEEIEACCNRLKDRGVSLLIGDVYTTMAAKRYGFNTILILSGQESVDRAMHEAVQLDRAIKKERQHTQTYRRILDHLNKCVVFGADESLLYTNEAEEENDPQLIEFLARYIPVLEKKKQVSMLKKIGENYWDIQGFRIDEGEMTAFYCKRGTTIKKLERGALNYRNFDDAPAISFETFYAKSPCLKETIEKAKKYGKSSLPVIIYGEEGSGKEVVAYATNGSSPFRDMPLVILDCRQIDDKQWWMLLKDPDSPFGYENYSFYIKNMQCLTEKQCKALEVYFDDTLLYKRNRMIFSYVPTRHKGFEKSSLLEYIYDKIGALPLAAPKLNEYTEDLPGLASLYLNELNIQMGRQVIGFEAGAIDLLQKFRWAGNLKQFRHVLRELVIVTEGDYILKKNVASALKYQLSRYAADPAGPALEGTLSDIVSGVVRAVLEEEGMNQSKAAKRLGISRSTLWRKLQGEHFN